MATPSLKVPATALSLVESTLGGVLIGFSAALFLALSGQRTGLSGILSGYLPSSYKPWKWSFASGFLGAVLVAALYFPSALDQSPGPQLNWAANVIGGLLVGFGTRLGNGCTSGHGVCGLARLSKRGLAAVLTFMAVGFITSTLLSNAAAFREPYSQQWDQAWSQSPSVPTVVVLGNKGQQQAPWNYWTVGMAVLVGLLVLGDVGGKAREGWALQLASVLCGAMFAAGLVYGKMAMRQKVLNFLWVGSSWDPSLLGVMGGAVMVNIVPTQYLLNRPGSKALLDSKTPIAVAGKSAWDISKAEVIDWKLLAGAVLFGAGWGVAGLCPGPAWVAVVAGFPKVVLSFLPAMVLGTTLHALLFTDRPAGGPPGTAKKAH